MAPVKVSQVADSTYLLDCAEDVAFPLSEVVYVLDGDPPVMIEPGSTTTAAQLLAHAAASPVDFRRLAYIIPTHIHVDHGGGAGYLARHLPGTKIVLHPRGARNLADPSRLVAATKGVFGEDFEQRFGPIMAVPEGRMHIARDNEVIHLGSRDLTILFTPGHASHHIAIGDSLTQGVFPGEALGYIATAMPDFPLPAAVPPFDLRLYLESIDRLAAMAPAVLFYSHCGARSRPEALIRGIRENSISLGQVVQKAMAEGQDPDQIWARLSDFVRQKGGAEIPAEFMLGLSAYVSYFGAK